MIGRRATESDMPSIGYQARSGPPVSDTGHLVSATLTYPTSSLMWELQRMSDWNETVFVRQRVMPAYWRTCGELWEASGPYKTRFLGSIPSRRTSHGVSVEEAALLSTYAKTAPSLASTMVVRLPDKRLTSVRFWGGGLATFVSAIGRPSGLGATRNPEMRWCTHLCCRFESCRTRECSSSLWKTAALIKRIALDQRRMWVRFPRRALWWP